MDIAEATKSICAKLQHLKVKLVEEETDYEIFPPSLMFFDDPEEAPAGSVSVNHADRGMRWMNFIRQMTKLSDTRFNSAALDVLDRNGDLMNIIEMILIEGLPNDEMYVSHFVIPYTKSMGGIVFKPPQPCMVPLDKAAISTEFFGLHAGHQRVPWAGASMHSVRWLRNALGAHVYGDPTWLSRLGLEPGSGVPTDWHDRGSIWGLS